MKELIETFIKSGLKVHDRAVLHSRYIIEDFDAKTGELVRRQEFDHNCLLNEGITTLLNLLINEAETAFSNANAHIGVGDDDTVADPAQTGLQATENEFYGAMDATYPQVSEQTVTFRSTFATDEANFAWEEITVANGGSDAADNLNRKVQAMGEKTSAAVRIVTVAITIE